MYNIFTCFRSSLLQVSIRLTLILITIPIHTKISIPKVPTRVSSIFSRSKEEITHHEFNNVQKLELSTVHGNISIETWKQPCVLIELRKKGTAHFLAQATLQHQQKDHTLYASTRLKDQNITGTMNIHVLVPDHLPLKLTTTKGNITIKAHNGALDLTTQWGNITITQGTNTVLAKTVQGNIKLQRNKMKPGHALNLQADHGNITLSVPQELEADLEAHTDHGKINSELFISLHQRTIQLNEQTFKAMKHHVHGWIGQPQDTDNPVTILLTTQYGFINILPYKKKSGN